jgi:hypothetical protein
VYMLDVNGSTDSLLPERQYKQRGISMPSAWPAVRKANVAGSRGSRRSLRLGGPTKDLRGGGGGHGSQEKRVADAVLEDLGTEAGPVPAVRRRHAPHVELEDALRKRSHIEVSGSS